MKLKRTCCQLMHLNLFLQEAKWGRVRMGLCCLISKVQCWWTARAVTYITREPASIKRCRTSKASWPFNLPCSCLTGPSVLNRPPVHWPSLITGLVPWVWQQPMRLPGKHRSLSATLGQVGIQLVFLWNCHLIKTHYRKRRAVIGDMVQLQWGDMACSRRDFSLTCP